MLIVTGYMHVEPSELVLNFKPSSRSRAARRQSLL